MSETKCRRCSECVGARHHWLDNDDFGRDASDLDPSLGERNDCDYVCKHCPAGGIECSACGGEGTDWLDPDDPAEIEKLCPICGGEGVIEIP